MILLANGTLGAMPIRSLPSRNASDESLGRDETSFVRLNHEQCIFTISNPPIFFLLYNILFDYTLLYPRSQPL